MTSYLVRPNYILLSPKTSKARPTNNTLKRTVVKDYPIPPTQRNRQHDQPTASASAPNSANSIRISYNNEPATAGGNFKNNSNYLRQLSIIPSTIYLQGCPSTKKPHKQPHHNESKYYYELKPPPTYLPNIISTIFLSRSQHKKAQHKRSRRAIVTTKPLPQKGPSQYKWNCLNSTQHKPK